VVAVCLKTIEDAIAAMVRPGRRIEPIAANVALYDEIYAQYAALYPALKTVREAGVTPSRH
jgi:sugar (pentulose or hexulose) kinase